MSVPNPTTDSRKGVLTSGTGMARITLLILGGKSLAWVIAASLLQPTPVFGEIAILIAPFGLLAIVTLIVRKRPGPSFACLVVAILLTAIAVYGSLEMYSSVGRAHAPDAMGALGFVWALVILPVAIIASLIIFANWIAIELLEKRKRSR